MNGKLDRTGQLKLTPAQEAARDSVRQGIVLTLSAAVILTIIGVVMVFSATSVSSISEALVLDDPAARFFQAQRQLMFAIAGFVLVPIAIAIPPGFYKKMVWWLFGFGIVLQMLVLTPLARSEGGNTNWISLGGILLQPSEFLKLAAILFVSVMLGRLSREQMSQWREVIYPAGAGAVAALVAVLVGKDMGTALVYMCIFAVGFWMAGIPIKWVAAAGLFGSVAVLILVVLVPSRIQRITHYFENLWIMPDTILPTQSDHAMWAFGTGGFGGAGLGASREKWNYLAAAHNDFIFAVIGEELGLGGCLAVIILYCVLGYGLLKITLAHSKSWVRYFTGMAAIWLVGQAFLNMMVVTGVLPVFGVPLPFISQGGSALIACLLCVGVAISLALRQPGVMESFRLKGNLSFRSAATLRRPR